MNRPTDLLNMYIYKMSKKTCLFFVQIHKTNILLKITLKELRNIHTTDHTDHMGVLMILQVFPIVTNKHAKFQSAITKHYRITTVDGPTAYICEKSKGYNSVLSVNCTSNRHASFPYYHLQSHYVTT